MLTSGTIEEKIFQRQLTKTGLSESVVDPNAISNVKLSLEEIKVGSLHKSTQLKNNMA